MDPTGANIARSDDKSLKHFGDRSYFQSSMKGEASSRQVLISKSTNMPALTLSVPIRNALSVGPHGVLAMAMKLDDISKVINDTRIGETGYAILLDAENKLIAHGNPKQRKQTVQDFGEHPAFKVGGIHMEPTIYSTNGKEVVGYARKLPQGWTLLVEQDYAEAYASLERLETQARMLIVLTGTLVVGFAYLLGKQLTRPIKDLIIVAEQLSKGQFRETIPGTERGDEIGALARAVERLGISIRLAMDRLRKQA
jgi:methyl-accepting chemotaxis protein